MAIRSSSRIKREVVSTRGPGHDIRDAVSYHASAILVLFVFTILTSLGLSLWMLKFYVAQDQYRLALDLVAGKVLSVEEQQDAGVGPAVAPHVYEESSVPGIFVSNTPCPPGELGECNDLIVAKQQQDGYEVIVKSVRSLMNSLGYDALAYPVGMSADGKTMAFRLGNENDTKELQEHIVLFDTTTRRVEDLEVALPVLSAFSPSVKYAAYLNSTDELVVTELVTGKKKTIARGTADKDLLIVSLTDVAVIFDIYSATDGKKIESRTVSFSF
ncbi:MAG: hypothetical protein WC787_03615 [Patescibacteria group bacterium]|jgi:hypothetical protein